MTSYEKYVVILCLIVFALLTLVFSSMLVAMTKQALRLIRAGTEDKRIYKDYVKAKKRGETKTGWSKTITVFFAFLIFVIFGLTLYMQVTADKQTSGVPSLRVVYSDSMSGKYERNTYLYENNLNNHFSRFDIVVTHKLPAEEDLKLYDIVVYEVDDTLLIHRIVGIEEPNSKHPNERYFLLQGDMVENADKFPVRYSQMKGIYRGQRIANIGSFIIFLQSPAGYLCFLLILVEMISSPIIKKKVEKEEQKRLKLILTIKKIVAKKKKSVSPKKQGEKKQMQSRKPALAKAVKK